jgi:hypothetical protein
LGHGGTAVNAFRVASADLDEIAIYAQRPRRHAATSFESPFPEPPDGFASSLPAFPPHASSTNAT